MTADRGSGRGARGLRVPAPETFSSRLRGEAVAARVGVWLAVCFGLAFLTGLISHYAQADHQPVPFPTSPSWGYRLTQGVHVASGTAAVPLLLVKLWTVYPHLFARPGRRIGELLRHGAERLSIAVLVAAAIFQLATGLANSAQWYPWEFSFRSTHYALAWVAVGALVVHIGVKLPAIRRGLARGALDAPTAPPTTPATPASPATPARTDGAPTRRTLLRATWLAAGAAVLATAGATVPALRRVSLLAVRSGEGPQGVPINKSAEAAGVLTSARAASYRLELVGPSGTRRLSRADLEALPQHTEELPIACVEGWSASGGWTGVRVRDLLALVGAPAASEVAVTSLQVDGAFAASVLPANFVADERTLLALALAGEPLHIDHGYPARIIAPNRPGVLQTKWVARLEVR